MAKAITAENDPHLGNALRHRQRGRAACLGGRLERRHDHLRPPRGTITRMVVSMPGRTLLAPFRVVQIRGLCWSDKLGSSAAAAAGSCAASTRW